MPAANRVSCPLLAAADRTRRLPSSLNSIASKGGLGVLLVATMCPSFRARPSQARVTVAPGQLGTRSRTLCGFELGPMPANTLEQHSVQRREDFLWVYGPARGEAPE